MLKADNFIRCQIAVQYSDAEGQMFVPGYFDEDLKFHPVWEKAVKSNETPDGWMCVGAFGGDTNKQVKAVLSVGGGVGKAMLQGNGQ